VRWIAFGIAGLAVVIGAALLVLSGREPRPNVVLIVLDTVRADVVGLDGPSGPLTPNLDAIAQESTTFTNAFAPAPWTVPSHASLFTGLFPHEHGANHGQLLLQESFETLAERLQAKGYATGGFTCNPWLNLRSGMAQGFDTYEEVYRRVEPDTDQGAAIATDMVCDWIRQQAERPGPFLLFVNYLEAHLPYAPPAPVRQRLESARTGPLPATFSLAQAEAHIIGKQRLSAEELQIARDLYHAEIAYLDDQIATVISCLRACNVLDNTLLIITSDHGEHLGKHDLMGHEFSVFEPVLRIPLLVRYPPRMPAGRRVHTPVSLVDVLPTVLDVLGDDDETLSGRSLLQFVAADRGPDRILLAEYSRPTGLIRRHWARTYPDVDMDRYDVSLRSLRKGRFKYIVTGRGDESLYDLVEDPGEQEDLSAVFTDRLSELRAELKALVGNSAPRT
jgi:arylsulfatase A-like enzyme